MKKPIKIILCSLTIIMILTANIFALGWAGYNPNVSDQTATIFDETVTSAYSATELEKIVNNAYYLGMFGGAKPIAVLIDKATYSVAFLSVVPVNFNGNEEINKNMYYGFIENNTVYSEPQNTVLLSLLLNNGDIYHVIGISENADISDYYIALLLSNEGDWYFDDNNSAFAQFHNINANVNNTLIQIADTYESALNGYTPPSEPSEPSEPQEPPVYVQYMLDIPGIITAVPNAAKQIVNNAFGFEIFGINVAGLLSAILIITIVAFAVKWLMSR